jgi:hypothetical protein
MVSITFTNQEELRIVARPTLFGQLNRSIAFFGEGIT